MHVTTETCFTLSHVAHEIALEKSKLELSLLKHLLYWLATCSNVHSLGNLESRLILAKMIWNFKIEICEETDSDWMDQEGYITFMKKPLIVKLTSRSR